MRWIAWLGTAVLWIGCAKVAEVAGPDDASSDVARGDGRVSSPPSDARDDVSPETLNGCVRSENLKAVSITQPVPFDVVIVADNSDSLSWSRDSLSAGLENLLSRVRGYEIRFFVLTSTQYGASSKAAVSLPGGMDLVSWQDSITRVPYANPVTEYRQGCVDEKGAAITCPGKDPDFGYTLNGEWVFQMPPPVATITPTMSDAQLTAEQKRIADAVLALGGGGAQQEQPICTLGRYVAQRPELLPKHVVFVVLSDEDDTSLPGACLASHQQKHTVTRTGPAVEQCSENCDSYDYGTGRPNEQEVLQYRCIPMDDKGMAHPELAVAKSLVVSFIARCANVMTGDCNAAALVRAGADCGGGYAVDRCKRTCAVQGGTVVCGLPRPDNRTDLCTQPFDERGTHYNNLLDYCVRTSGTGAWEPCRVAGFKAIPGTGGISRGYSEGTTPLIVGTSTADMISSFKLMADMRFGGGNYSVEAIVLDPAFACPVRPGQSFGNNLRQLASGPGDVFPLCQDYAPALARIERFGATLIRTDYPLDLNAFEAVDSVIVTDHAGRKRMLSATDYTYDRSAKILRFNPGALTAQDDSLLVNVARNCEPIP